MIGLYYTNIDFVAGPLIGLATGIVGGFLCFKAKRIVSCVLGFLFGSLISVVSYLIIFSWWVEGETVANLWMIACIITSIYLTCTRPKAMLIEITSTIGSTLMVSSLLDITTEKGYLAFSWMAVLGLAANVGLFFAGRYVQKEVFGSDKKQDDIEKSYKVPLMINT